MTARDIDWRDVLTGRIRAIQSAYPEAHEALTNWGIWCRDLRGIHPGLASPGLWKSANVDQWGAEGWGDEQEPSKRLHVGPIKGERLEEGKADEKAATELDVRIHADNFPPAWRKILKAAYVTAQVPEHQFPAVAGIGEETFLLFLDGALDHLT